MKESQKRVQPIDTESQTRLTSSNSLEDCEPFVRTHQDVFLTRLATPSDPDCNRVTNRTK